jgi:putative DNA primase/helicase
VTSAPHQLSDRARAWLRDSAITDEIIDSAGVWTIGSPEEVPEEFSCYREHAPGALIFPWRQGDRTELQIGWQEEDRWIGSDGKLVKYRHRKGADMLLNCVRDDNDGTVLLVEGTKQHLAVASWFPGAVYGFAGAYNWTKADLSFLRGREVVVLFDGDLRSNRMVHEAAGLFMEAAEVMGAELVRVGLIPTTSNDGIDDWMASQPAQARRGMIDMIIEKAKPTLPKPPSKKKTHPFFGEGGLLVDKLSKAVTDKYPAALTREERIAMYSHGVYNINDTALVGAVAEMLQDVFRPGHRAAVEEYTRGMLANAELFLPERPTEPLINLRNGMLDLTTGELKSHNPSYMSSLQLPVEWDPDARAPQYEDWLQSAIPHQIDDLEETTATMLDPMRTPSKAVFLYGPSRSGKSTFLRLMMAMAGPPNVSAVTLHQLVDDRFAAADVYGKMLNSAADLSSAHVEDLSLFKKMTGEDVIQGNRKYGARFVFTNRALFAFAANEPPTVGENSRAYIERIKPFRFDNSFAGHEDPSIERRMLTELPGILVRWVTALRRLQDRGQFQPIDTVVRADFEARSDRVRQWVAERCRIVSAQDKYGRAVLPGGHVPARDMTTKRDLARAFNRWAEDQAGAKMGERKIIDRLTSINGVVEVRDEKTRTRGFNLVLHSGEVGDGGDDGPAGAERAVSTHPTYNHFSNPLPQTVSEELKTEGSNRRLGEGGQKLPVVPNGSSEELRTTSPGLLSAVPSPGPSAQRVSPGQVVCGNVAIDLETGDADMRTLFSSGPEFIRLAGFKVGGDPIVTTTVLPAVAETVNTAGMIIGHNVMGYRPHRAGSPRRPGRGGARQSGQGARHQDPGHARRPSAGQDEHRPGGEALLAELGGGSPARRDQAR